MTGALITRFALAGLAVTLLAGCGVRGSLERPPPMLGRHEEAPPASAPSSLPDNPEPDQSHGVGGAANGAGVRTPTF
ncbi:MAG: lipoprotein [Hyphomonadaceae bacterium]